MAKLIDNGFHVKLDGFELNKEAQERIQLGIEEVVLRELAAHHSFGEGGSGHAVIIPSEWLGRILMNLSNAEVKNIRPGFNINAFTSK